LDKKLKKEIEDKVNSQMRVYCHQRGCLESYVVDWDGAFIDPWFCDYHAKINKKGVHKYG